MKSFICMALVTLVLTLQGVDQKVQAQDTLRIDFEKFVHLATERSSFLQAREQQVRLAENRRDEARNTRFLPSLGLTTAHGVVPGLTSSNPEITPGGYYLDPDLRNDWEDWAIFTQAEISGLQPIYTWGALKNVVKAAEEGVLAARHQMDSEKARFNVQLFELYQSALLVRELQRLLNTAKNQLAEAEEEIERLYEEGDPMLEERDYFEFLIFREEFQASVTELEQTAAFVRRSWNVVLGNYSNIVYEPAEQFLDPSPVQLQPYDFYAGLAISNRPELKGIQALENAARYGVDAARSRFYPALVMGFSGGIGYASNRPRQNNPLIRNSTNYMSTRIGVGLQLNLNFNQTRQQVQRSHIQLTQAREMHDAAVEGIRIELGEQYRKVKTVESLYQSKRNALRFSNEWLRTEQIDFDLGFGDIKNLVEAVKKKMELELELNQLVFDYNLEKARLFKTAGLPLDELIAPVQNP